MSVNWWIDEHNVIHPYSGILINHKEGAKYWHICYNMNEIYHTKWRKSDRERQISYDITYMQNLKNIYANELIYITVTDSQT